MMHGFMNAKSMSYIVQYGAYENLVNLQLLKKSPKFDGTRCFITLFTIMSLSFQQGTSIPDLLIAIYLQ
jgi:hypothetical protein